MLCHVTKENIFLIALIIGRRKISHCTTICYNGDIPPPPDRPSEASDRPSEASDRPWKWKVSNRPMEASF